MRIRRSILDKHDVVTARGLPATSMVRTLRDLCLRLSVTEAVVIADMALHAELITVEELSRSAAGRRHGVRKLRRIVRHVEPRSESPMETRLSMLLVLGRLPRPEAQVAIHHGYRLAGRLDLYYRNQRLGLEYDGGTHRESLAEDNRRQNRLVDAGIKLLRFTAADIYNTPDAVVMLVRSALVA
jgi:very-short-patch-repair endonuclease